MAVKLGEPYSIGADVLVVDVSFEIDEIRFTTLAFTDALTSVTRAAAKGNAASDMLEALERIVKVSKTIPAIRGGSLTGDECRALDQAEAAIRKAKSTINK